MTNKQLARLTLHWWFETPLLMLVNIGAYVAGSSFMAYLNGWKGAVVVAALFVMHLSGAAMYVYFREETRAAQARVLASLEQSRANREVAREMRNEALYHRGQTAKMLSGVMDE